MKQLIDFIPLIAFFTAYKTVDIYMATKVLMVVTSIQYGIYYLKDRKLENAQIITLVAVFLFGSLTLFMHDETFLKWKAPIVNWIFALTFLGSHFFGKDNIIKRMMGHAVNLPEPVWTKLNYSWVVFFIISGAANLYVAFTFHEIWVDFKVFGSLGMTLVFLVGQTLYLSRHIIEEDEENLTAEPIEKE